MRKNKPETTAMPCLCVGVWLCRWQEPFINLGEKFLPNLGVAGVAIVMVWGALVIFVIVSSYAYMVLKYSKAGSEFTF